MSKEWVNFPMWEERPADTYQYAQSDRELLEHVIAQQVADLLSLFGAVSINQVDNTDEADFDGSQSFYGIAIEPFVLEDDGEIRIEQIPAKADGFITEKGAHFFERVDEDDIPIRRLAVWDPAVDTPTRIHDETGAVVEIPYLQEVHEALIVMTKYFMANVESNPEPFITSEYPIRVIEPELELLEQHFKM